MASNMISGVTPGSSTAQMAANVPKESEREGRPVSNSSDLGSVPDTPFHEAQEFAVDPIPATSGIGNPIDLAPGDKVPHPNTLTSNTILSTVKDDPSLAKSADDSQQTFGVAPLPATTGIGNPISLRPGEKVPDSSTFTSNTINSNVTTDKASYENGPGGPQASNQTDSAQGGMFSMPPISNSRNMIPESSLPMGEGNASMANPGATIQSVGANSTTAALAGQVPKEPRGVPEVVSESQHEAGVGPEASGNREAVKEKTAMEKELENKVPEEPATSEGSGGKAGGAAVGGAVAGGLAAGGLVGGGAAAASHGLPSSVQKSIDEMNKGTPVAPTVPDVVQESIAESHQSPEAAGSKTMVGEKSAMEKELLKEVKTENATGQPAPSSSAALTGVAPAATPSTPAKDAGVTTAAAPAKTPATENSMTQAIKKPEQDSRDVSPMSHPAGAGQTQPAVTTGIGSSKAPQASTPDKDIPARGSPAASSSAGQSDKKSKRASGFFGKMKSKLSGKDKS